MLQRQNCSPKEITTYLIDWYHTVLCYLGINKTGESIAQHLFWQQSREQVTKYMQTCPIFQKNKNKVEKYGWLSPKKAGTVQ